MLDMLTAPSPSEYERMTDKVRRRAAVLIAEEANRIDRAIILRREQNSASCVVSFEDMQVLADYLTRIYHDSPDVLTRRRALLFER